MSRLRLLMMAEQLRRPASGGIGTYIRGLIQGLDELTHGGTARVGPDGQPAAAGRGDAVPLADLGHPLHGYPLPGPVLTRAWDHGLLRCPRGFDVVHATSLSTLEPGRAASGHDRARPALAPGARRLSGPGTDAGTRRHCAGPSAGRRGSSCRPRWWPTTSWRRERTGPTSPSSPWGPTTCRHRIPRRPRRCCPPWGSTGPFLLSVGTFEPRKNQVRLVEAYERIRGVAPRAVAAGDGGPERVGRAGAPRAPGWCSPAWSPRRCSPALFATARLLAYVPLIEGFGLPPVEAMAFDTPVVASPLPSTAGAAHEVDPLDSDSIADGLLVVATDEVERSRLRLLGRGRSSELRWSGIARQHLAVWDEAKGTRTGHAGG